jgi:3-keto-L-gulonate-6-phosphate decarboxylase
MTESCVAVAFRVAVAGIIESDDVGMELSTVANVFVAGRRFGI